MSAQVRPTALVTGASSGIGAAFAQALAARGYDLVLNARRASRLEETATALQLQHQIKTLVVAEDLSDPMAPRRITDTVHAHGLQIDMLVNNAGYGLPGRFDEQAWMAHNDFLQVMIHAPTELAHRVLPGMLDRGHGRIINIASLAGHLPGSTGHTLYAASKAYMIRFSQSLALENRSRGVNVCALCPGFTYSEFHDATGTRDLVSRMPSWMWMDADTVARQGLDAVERGDVVYINGRVNRAIKALSEMLPDRLALRLSDRHSRRYRSLEKPPGADPHEH
jgi:short-subunit dehydrogenase